MRPGLPLGRFAGRIIHNRDVRMGISCDFVISICLPIDSVQKLSELIWLLLQYFYKSLPPQSPSFP